MALEDKLDELGVRIRELILALQTLERRLAIESINTLPSSSPSSTPPPRDVDVASKRRGLVTIGEAAEILACAPATVRAWMQRRQLPRVTVGRLVRIRRDDLDRVINRGLPARSEVAIDGKRIGRRRAG